MYQTIDGTFRAKCAAEAEFLRQVAAHDSPRVWEGEGASFTTQWLNWRYGLVWKVAEELVRVARALRFLPCIAQAHQEGLVSYEKLRPLTRLADPSTDEQWSVTAQTYTAGWLYQEAARCERVTRETAEQIHKARLVEIRWNEDHTEGEIYYRGGAREVSTVVRKLRETAKAIPTDPEADDAQGARLADALVRMAQGEPSASGKPVLIVHADVEVLTGDVPEGVPVVCETEEGGRLCSEQVAELARDAKIEWHLETEGRGVGVGFTKKEPPEWLVRRLRFRDPHCRGPGCRTRTHLKNHHIKHWPHGPTDEENLVRLCAFHHRLVHRGGWSIRGTPSRGLRFFDSHGGEITPMPRERPG